MQKNRCNITATLGLVVHAAVDGIALGAAATTSHTEVEIIVFLAIMLHKVIYPRKLFLDDPNIACLTTFLCTNNRGLLRLLWLVSCCMKD